MLNILVLRRENWKNFVSSKNWKNLEIEPSSIITYTSSHEKYDPNLKRRHSPHDWFR